MRDRRERRERRGCRDGRIRDAGTRSIAPRSSENGGKPENKRVTRRVTRNIRVELIKYNQQLGIIRVERVVETRLNPLKAMQVVDIPHIAKNKGVKGMKNKGDHGDKRRRVILMQRRTS